MSFIRSIIKNIFCINNLYLCSVVSTLYALVVGIFVLGGNVYYPYLEKAIVAARVLMITALSLDVISVVLFLGITFYKWKAEGFSLMLNPDEEDYDE